MTHDPSQTPSNKTADNIVPSEETKQLVDKRMPEESDEVKQKFAELIEAIKRQAANEAEAAGEMTRESYLQAVARAKATLNTAQGFFLEQEQALQRNMDEFRDEATQRWEEMMRELEKVSNRFERAVETAWTILTEPEQGDQQNRPKQ